MTSLTFFFGMVFTNKAVEIGMDIGSHFFGKNPMKQVPKGIPRSGGSTSNGRPVIASSRQSMTFDRFIRTSQFIRRNPSIIVHDASNFYSLHPTFRPIIIRFCASLPTIVLRRVLRSLADSEKRCDFRVMYYDYLDYPPTLRRMYVKRS